MSDTDADSSEIDQYIDLYRRLLVENYCILATSALLFYDHITTFSDEVQRIWNRKFSGATLIFLITRYSATFERMTLVTSLFLVTTRNEPAHALKYQKAHDCVPVLRLDDTLNDINIFIVGAFAALRVYAIFGRDWKLLIPMLSIALARTGISLYFQTHYTPLAFGAPLWGCGAVFNFPDDQYYRLNTATNALGLASDTLLLVLTWLKTFGIRKASTGVGLRTPITTLLLRDGTIYFILLFSIQVFAIVSIQIGSNFPLFTVWTYWNQSFTVIFLCRFMLNLRGVYISDPGYSQAVSLGPGFTQISNLHFASNVVGNLGAPLDTITTSTATRTTTMTETDASTEYYSREDDDETVEVSSDPLGIGLVDRLPDMVEMDTYQSV